MTKNIIVEIEIEDVYFDINSEEEITFELPDINYKDLVVSAIEKTIDDDSLNGYELASEIYNDIKERQIFND